MGFIPGEEWNVELGLILIAREGFIILGVRIGMGIIVVIRKEMAQVVGLVGFG